MARARMSRAEFCARAPKVELHVHFDGAFDSAYLFECARKYAEDLPEKVNLGGTSVRLQEAVRSAASPQAFLERYIHLPPTTAKLTDFLAPFPLSMAIVKAAVRAEGLAAIEEFAYRFAQRQHASNALYTEVRYCPHLFLEDALLADAPVRLAAAEEVVRAVGRGLRRGEQRLGVVLRQILCCLDFAPQWSAECATLLQTVGREGGLVGIDVAAGEAHFAEGADDPTRRAVRTAKPGPNPNPKPDPDPSPIPNSNPNPNPNPNPKTNQVLAARAEGFGVAIHAGEDRSSRTLTITPKPNP